MASLSIDTYMYKDKDKAFMKGDQTPKSNLYFDGTDDGRGRGLGLQGVVPVGRLKS